MLLQLFAQWVIFMLVRLLGILLIPFWWIDRKKWMRNAMIAAKG